MLGWIGLIGLCVSVLSLTVNLVQWIQQSKTKDGLLSLKTSILQIRAWCNDAEEKKLIGLDAREQTFVSSLGHNLNIVLHQIDNMLGEGLKGDLKRRSGGWWKRCLRFLFPLAPIPYEAPSERPRAATGPTSESGDAISKNQPE